MQTKRLIRFDWAIKTILRNKANFSILEGFLSELLHTDVIIETLLESESNKESAEDKSNRVDVLARLAGGEKVLIEVQCVRQWDYLHRMLYGTSKAVVESLKEGEKYGSIPRVISVNIVYFDLGHGKDYIYRGTTNFEGIHQHDILSLKKKEKERYLQNIETVSNVFPEYYVLKVGIFDLKIKDTLDEWMYALKKSEVPSEFKAKGIQDAGKKLDILKLSDKERVQYEEHLKDDRNFNSSIETSYIDGLFEGTAKGLAKGKEEGKEEGIAEGEARGKAEATAEIAKTMHRSGLPIEQICEITGFTQDHVQKIIESL